MAHVHLKKKKWNSCTISADTSCQQKFKAYEDSVLLCFTDLLSVSFSQYIFNTDLTSSHYLTEKVTTKVFIVLYTSFHLASSHTDGNLVTAVKLSIS